MPPTNQPLDKNYKKITSNKTKPLENSGKAMVSKYDPNFL